MVALASERTALSLDELRVGVTLPVAIHNGTDVKSMLLHNRGMQLTPEALARLKARGIQQIYVSSHFAKLIRNPKHSQESVRAITNSESCRAEVVSAAFHPAHDIPRNEFDSRSRVIDLVNERTRDLLSAASGRPSIEASQEIVEAELKSLKASCDLFVSLGLPLTRPADRDWLHGLRVGRVAMAMALAEDKPDDEITQIGLGCLLMDIGLSDEARRLKQLDRGLSRIEMLEIEKHPSKTYDILAKEHKMSPTARFLAYQVHERCDGSGYPRGKTRAGISDGALIAMVAECFVAMISDRPHRPAILPTHAVRQLFQMANYHKVDSRKVEILVSVVSALPVGTKVKLSNGLHGVVKISRARAPLNPVVEIEPSLASVPASLCLLTTSNVRITEVVWSTQEA